MDSLMPLTAFAFAASITPGPNNLMLAASGVAFGWQRTVPHMLGIPVGFSVLILVCGLGVGTLVASVPAAGLALKVFGTAYLIYLAWVMRHALSADESARVAARPIRFIEAALFQFANPKAWIMALTAVSLAVPDAVDPWAALAVVWLGFTLTIFPCTAAWVGVGIAARRALVDERWRRLFGAAIVLLMAYTVIGIWI